MNGILVINLRCFDEVIFVLLFNDKYVFLESLFFKLLCILVDCIGVVEFEVKFINVGFENDRNKVNFNYLMEVDGFIIVISIV